MVDLEFAGIAIAKSPVLGPGADVTNRALELCWTPLSWHLIGPRPPSLCSRGGPGPAGVDAVPHGARVHSSPVSVPSGLVPCGFPSRRQHITVQRRRSGCRGTWGQSLRGPDGR